MKNTYDRVSPFKHHSLVILYSVLMTLLFNSCKEESSALEQTEGDLITKINAVQEQIMTQGNVTKEEEQALLSLCSIVSQDDGMAIYTSDNSILLKNVDVAPVYPDCKEPSIEETRACFKRNISAFFEREFDLSIIKDSDVVTPKQVEAFFIVDEKGNLTGMKVRNSEVIVQAEILRVLRKMPKMESTIHAGESVSVLCSILVTYGNEIDVDVIYIPERPE